MDYSRVLLPHEEGIFNPRAFIFNPVIPSLTRKGDPKGMPSCCSSTPELLSLSTPTDANLITSLCGLHIPGETTAAESSARDLSVEMEGPIDENFDYGDLRLNLDLKHSKMTASWKTGFSLPVGVTVTHEVGSPDGRTNVLAPLKPDLVSPFGFSMNKWIEQEKGGPFLLMERLTESRNLLLPKEEPKLNGRGFYELPVLPIMAGVITDNPEEDPFPSPEREKRDGPRFDTLPTELSAFGKSNLYDLREILAWSDKSRLQSKRAKDFTDIVRLVEAHPELWGRLNSELQSQIDRP
jgi:hypothetical protein